MASAAPSASSPRRHLCSMVGLPQARLRGPRSLNGTGIASPTSSLYTRSMSQTLTRAAPAFEPLDTESLASRIADRIVDAVAAGTLAPGQRLVEAEIAAALGVSRMPLREALKLLEAQGILSVTPRRGSFVVPFDERRIGQICDARLALERLALRRGVPAFRAAPGLLAERDGLIGTMRQEAERRAWLAANKAALAFHRRIVAAADDGIVAMLWEALARHVLIVFGREIRDEADARRLEEPHVRLRELLAAGDVGALEEEIERHIMRLRPGP